MGRAKESTYIHLQYTQADQVKADKFSLPITTGIFHIAKNNKTVNEFTQSYQTLN